MQNNTKPRSPRLLVLILFAAAIAAAALGTFFFAFCHITEKAPVTSPKKADPIAVRVKHMTTEEKVGQLFIVTPDQLTGSHVTAADAATREAIAKTQPGGLIYFDDNLKNPAQTQALLKDTRQIYNDLGLPVPFLAVDEEGGEVARVAHNPAFGVQNVGDMRAVGRTGNPAKAAAVGTTLGTYLKGLGFNLDFAPDADVLTNPANRVVVRRSFGTDPALVKQMSEAEARALSACGVLPCLKHFPGHGATTGDTHAGTAATDKTLDQMMQAELVPFNDVNAYAPMIMAGHIAAPKVTGDNTPRLPVAQNGHRRPERQAPLPRRDHHRLPADGRRHPERSPRPGRCLSPRSRLRCDPHARRLPRRSRRRPRRRPKGHPQRKTAQRLGHPDSEMQGPT